MTTGEGLPATGFVYFQRFFVLINPVEFNDITWSGPPPVILQDQIDYQSRGDCHYQDEIQKNLSEF
jgi:hypothetical protein